MRLAVITTGHAPYKGELMEKSAARVGIEVFRIGADKPWPKDYRVAKLIHGQETVANLPADVTHVMYVDCSDSLFVRGPEDIILKFEEFHDRGFLAVVQAEKNCYPDVVLAREYPPSETAWKYVNSGGWICRREDALRIMAYVAELGAFCDQRCWSRAYLTSTAAAEEEARDHRMIALDDECRIFQSMYLQQPDELRFSEKLPVNQVTGRMPCVMHWNGTKNEGSPYSRDGVWELLTGEKPEKQETKVPTICVAMPGSAPSSFMWVFGWSELYLNLVKFFGPVRMVFSSGNNIYQVRENCLRMAAQDPNGPPDYFLWLDSDNPPNAKNFAHLWAAMQLNPVVSCVGGWYRFSNQETGEVFIAAGKIGEKFRNITEEEILSEDHLIQVPFIGFGMCLMKWQMIADVGIEKCFEPYMFSEEERQACGRTWATDDAGFFIRATRAGHKIFLHPAVFVQHEKQMNVPATLELGNLTPALKEL